jgi:hypothetical protein
MQTNTAHRNTLESISKLILITAFLGSSISYGIVYAYHLVIAIHFLAIIWTGNFKNFVAYAWTENRIWILLSSYSVLSILWAPNLPSALQYNGYWLSGCYMVIACGFQVTDAAWMKVNKSLSVLFVCGVVLAILEICTPIRWPISEYSKLNELFGRPVKVFENFFDSYPTSFFWHQNNCALVSLMGIPLVLKSEHRLRFLVLMTCYLIIFFSGSKSILVLALGYGLFYLGKVLVAGRLRIGLQKVLIFVTVIFASTWIAYFMSNEIQKLELNQAVSTVEGYVLPGPKFLLSRLTGEEFDFSKLHGNIRERYFFMDGAFDIFSGSPIFGAGAGAHLAARYQKHGQDIPLRSIHNYLLELFICFGPIFFCLYAYALYQMLRKSPLYRESLVLFLLGSPVLASAIYFLPKWLLYSLANRQHIAKKELKSS